MWMLDDDLLVRLLTTSLPSSHREGKGGHLKGQYIWSFPICRPNQRNRLGEILGRRPPFFLIFVQPYQKKKGLFSLAFYAVLIILSILYGPLLVRRAVVISLYAV